MSSTILLLSFIIRGSRRHQQFFCYLSLLGGVDVINYSFGWKDVCTITFYTLCWIVAHAIVQEYILDVSLTYMFVGCLHFVLHVVFIVHDKQVSSTSIKNPKQHSTCSVVNTKQEHIVTPSTVEKCKSKLSELNVAEWLLFDRDANGKAQNLRCKFCNLKTKFVICQISLTFLFMGVEITKDLLQHEVLKYTHCTPKYGK